MSGGYSGGGIMVAAETKEQAFLTAARDKKNKLRVQLVGW